MQKENEEVRMNRKSALVKSCLPTAIAEEGLDHKALS